MTEKQIMQSVLDGKRVTFSVFESEPVIGYVAGMDTERFFVLQPTMNGRSFARLFVARAGSGTPLFQIHEGSTYQDEPCVDEMESIIAPFRDWISHNVRRRPPRAQGRSHHTRRSERAAS